MIIHKSKKKIKGNKVRISSYIEIEKRKELSKTLWFEVDKEYEKYVSKSLNGFLSSLILQAMYLKEDIKVKDKISPKLNYGLNLLQGYFDFWKNHEFESPRAKKFNKVNIETEGYEVPKKPNKNVGCTFTGGVDSFYTLWKHTPENEPNPDFRITHCIIVDNGKRPLFDCSEDSYDLLKEKYKKFTKKLNMKLIIITTNIEDVLVKKLYSPETHATIILGAGLILEKLFHRFYIPSSHNYKDQIPWGSNPLTDPMISTENFNVIHHGCDKTRIEKTIEIAKWPETYDNLRVCWDSIGTKNCGECSKCIRTMVTLHLIKSLSKYNTFLKPLKRNKIRTWHIKGTDKKIFSKGLINYAIEKNRTDIEYDIRYAIIRSNIIDLFNKVWMLIWMPSAYLKKKSKLYTKFVRIIKNDYS
ncbi:hypothetical protein KY334_02240 [Candidatus Woesearchaeota archaeon]|nr:hypothetical protein [Candidatus Woesearchaeota archaeon]